jgi:hypothetical protein
MEGGGPVNAAPSPLLPWSRLGAVAPVPFVGTATILVALIVFTPVLLGTGPSPLAVRAELVVYRVVGGTTTDFYVHAVGSDVPYSQVRVALGTGFAWRGSCPTSGLNWTYSNRTNLLDLSVIANLTPVVVNATAVYNSGGTTTVYAGELAFAIIGLGATNEAIAIAPCPWTSAESPPASWSVSNLPLTLLLVNYGSGGP